MGILSNRNTELMSDPYYIKCIFEGGYKLDLTKITHIVPKLVTLKASSSLQITGIFIVNELNHFEVINATDLSDPEKVLENLLKEWKKSEMDSYIQNTSNRFENLE